MSLPRNSTAAIKQALPVLRVPEALAKLDRALAGKSPDAAIRAAVLLAEAVRHAIRSAEADITAAGVRS
jgi:hypothetical protein